MSFGVFLIRFAIYAAVLFPVLEVYILSQKRYLVIHHTVGPDPGDSRYHVVIAKNGKPRFAALPEAPVSATYLYNSYTTNIALVGDFTREHPTEAQLKTLEQILVAWCWRLSLSESDITYHGWIGQNAPGGPRYSTQCAGDNLICLLPEIRKRVKRYLIKSPS